MRRYFSILPKLAVLVAAAFAIPAAALAGELPDSELPAHLKRFNVAGVSFGQEQDAAVAKLKSNGFDCDDYYLYSREERQSICTKGKLGKAPEIKIILRAIPFDADWERVQDAKEIPSKNYRISLIRFVQGFGRDVVVDPGVVKAALIERYGPPSSDNERKFSLEWDSANAMGDRSPYEKAYRGECWKNKDKLKELTCERDGRIRYLNAIQFQPNVMVALLAERTLSIEVVWPYHFWAASYGNKLRWLDERIAKLRDPASRVGSKLKF